MHQRPDILTAHNAFEITHNIHVKHVDGQVILLTHRGCGEVHHLQAPRLNLVVGYFCKLCGRWVFLWVGRIDAVHARTF